MMQSPDLEVLKDIPGYKAILKAVLRSQIQLLVEQLSDHTGEESVLLTANLSDGSISHLGSDSGKVFLEDHDEIKSQFLGFCLKRHHKRKQPEPPPRMMPDYPIQPEPRRSSMPSIVTAAPSLQKRPRISESFSASQTATPLHPVTVPRVGRQQRTSQSSTSLSDQSPSHTQSMADLAQDSNGTVKQEALESSETQEPVSETSKTRTSEEIAGDDDSEETRIKLEPMTESELDLEITGVEMGDASMSGQMGFGQTEWSQNAPYSQSGEGGQEEGMGYDSGSQSEFGNRYTGMKEMPLASLFYRSRRMPTGGRNKCTICGKLFDSSWSLNRHTRTHTGEKPFQCTICKKSFTQKGNMEMHRVSHFEWTSVKTFGRVNLAAKKQ